MCEHETQKEGRKCNYCGAKLKAEQLYCLNCFPLYKCKDCGYVTGYIGSGGHTKPNTNEYCTNTVKGCGDTRWSNHWLVITNDSHTEIKP